MDDKFYESYMRWLNNGGASALFYYMKNLKLKGFNPAARAFKTQAKERMINNVMSDLGAWVRQLRDAPLHTLRVGDIVVDKDLMTSKELLMFYDSDRTTKTTANGLGRELSRAEFRQVCKGKPIKLKDGSQNRYYIIKNQDLWLNAERPDIINYLEENNG